MGVIVKERNKGEWWLFITHKGKRKAKKIGGDESAAREAAKKIGAHLTLGDLKILQPESESPTFKEIAEKWLSTYIQTTKRTATHRSYKDHLRMNIFPLIGGIPMDQIKRSHVREVLLDAAKRGYAKSTIGVIKNAISGVMNYAMDAEIVPANLTRGVLKTIGIKEAAPKEFDPFTGEEVELFLKACAKHFPEWYVFCLAAFRTGMREGELLALKWEDVDFNGRFIRVSRSYRDGVIAGTKTNKARRVDMSDQLFQVLKTHYVKAKEEGLRMGLGAAPEFIFRQDGKPIERYVTYWAFKKILVKAGLRSIRFHDVRHTYASLLLSAGASPVYVSKQMGHSTIRITVDVYGHWIPSEKNQVINVLDSGFQERTLQPAATYPQPKPLSI